jgi:hypothetical protein
MGIKLFPSRYTIKCDYTHSKKKRDVLIPEGQGTLHDPSCGQQPTDLQTVTPATLTKMLPVSLTDAGARSVLWRGRYFVVHLYVRRFFLGEVELYFTQLETSMNRSGTLLKSSYKAGTSGLQDWVQTSLGYSSSNKEVLIHSNLIVGRVFNHAPLTQQEFVSPRTQSAVYDLPVDHQNPVFGFK